MRTSRESGAIHILLVAAAAVVVVATLGWLVFQQLNNNTASSEARKSSSELASSIESISQWGVSYDLPPSIKKVEGSIDASKNLFPGDVYIVESIRIDNGVFSRQTHMAVDQESAVDGICSFIGIGRSRAASIKNPTTGGFFTQIASDTAGYRYYDVTASGAVCAQTKEATAAIAEVKQSFTSIRVENNE